MKKILELFKNTKKRRLLTLALITPFLIVIIICGVLIFNEAKNVIGLASDTGSDSKYVIGEKDYVLRNSATDIQKEYFKELKEIIESGVQDESLAESVVKNFVADFYTLSNKEGQYDVGGMYYVYSNQRYDIYIQARDQFYKYLSNYIEKYGKENLLEVTSVEATATYPGVTYMVSETNEETGESYAANYTEYLVEANWTYATKDGGFNTAKYDTKGYFVVIDRAGRFEIVYASNKEYEVPTDEE